MVHPYQSSERLHGLTDGLSNKIMRANRSALLPSLIMMHQSTHGEKTDLLHDRLEELLVFEILKDGDASYRNFTVRTLYKHVMKAIKIVPSRKRTSTPNRRRTSTPQKLFDQLPLGRAVVGGAKTPIDVAVNVTSIDEKEQVVQPNVECVPSHDSPEGDQRGEGTPEPVTWRERLGGYLHPRDMRKLVTPFSASNEPELIVRRHVMLLNFDPLRAVILRDRLIVLVPDGADSILVQLEKRIRAGVTNGLMTETQVSEITASDSQVSLNNLDTTNKSGLVHIPDAMSDTVPLNDDEVLAASFIDSEWAELEGKDWIDLPFELQSVDAVLSIVSSIMADDVLDLQLGANGIIADLVKPNSDAGDHAQETLRTMKNAVKEMTSRVKGFNRAIDSLLDDYEDMALMNLCRLLTHPDRFVQPVPQAVLEEESDEPELILEAHLQRGHTLINALSLVDGQIGSTEDFAVRKSDAIRNRLLYINMLISILSLAVALGSFVGSIFGMNVINDFEDSPNAFKVILWSTVLGALGFVILVLVVLRRLGALPNVFGSVF